MSPSTRGKLRSIVRGIGVAFFITAVALFLFGGGVISAITGTERIPAELEGIGLAALSAGLGVIAKAAQDRLEEGEPGPRSLTEALRK
jgi:hypothetical protein